MFTIRRTVTAESSEMVDFLRNSSPHRDEEAKKLWSMRVLYSKLLMEEYRRSHDALLDSDVLQSPELLRGIEEEEMRRASSRSKNNVNIKHSVLLQNTLS